MVLLSIVSYYIIFYEYCIHFCSLVWQCIFSIQVKLSPSVIEHVSIKGEVVKYLGARKLSQYDVTDIKIITKSSDYIMIEFTLQRMYSFYLATTYLPSICLLLAAEITLFIDESHFEATTMVALTAMLVMYTMYQSTAQSLPQTSYLKMIDIWLLPGLLIPFLVFCLEVWLIV